MTELEVVLTYTDREMTSLTAEVSELFNEIRYVEQSVSALKARTESLARKLEVQTVQGDSAAETPVNHETSESESWEVLLGRAEEHLSESGLDATDLSLAELLESGRADAIDELHSGTFDGSIRLDPYDIAAAVMAGMAGALVDLLVVRIPTGGVWNGEWQTGSDLTFSLREGAIDNDNWLSGIAKAPFDRVNSTGIDGMGPRSHRVQTFGHDPLLGLGLGTIDIMRGTLTGIDTSSVIHVVDVGNPTPNLLAAVGLEVGHLLSDVVTRMGLPIPGWTAVVAVPFGSLGPDELSVGQMARWMYLRGFGTWHLATMATSVTVTEVVIRAYYAMRQLLDDEYSNRVSVERARANASRVSDEPRYRSLSLLAHGIAAAGNAGKLLLAGGNPLAINVAQWAVLGRKVIQAMTPDHVGEVLTGQHAANVQLISTGWANLTMQLDKT